MIEVQYNGNVASIDLRERISRGEHPKAEVLNFIKEAKSGTVIEIHLPHRAQPLIAAIESLGINAIVTELSPIHFQLMCVKL